MRVEDWGTIDYATAVLRQEALVDQVAADKVADTLVVCTHPPIVTLGRGHVETDLTGWTGEILPTARGGRATYHGPSQVVIYPILSLLRVRQTFRPRDVHAYLRVLEDCVVRVLVEVGLPDAEARTSRVGEISLTGVWVDQHKVASIGIAVRKWTAYHGVAINVRHDPMAFVGIRPCGFEPEVMTSVEAALGQTVKQEEFKQLCVEVFGKGLR